MPNHRFTIISMTVALAFAAAAEAQSNRTFVSTAGSDSNNCGPTTPCRTFAAALAVTNPEGELVVLTSGGYGAFTITHPVTITAIGVDASVTATSGNAISINTTRNVTINGLGLYGEGTGEYGINVTSVGLLRLYNVTAENFALYGVWSGYSGGSLSVLDSHLSDNFYVGLVMESGNAFVRNTVADHNGVGFAVVTANAVIEDSAARLNTLVGFSNEGPGTLSLVRDEAVQNGTGITAAGGNTQFSYCNVTQNSTPIYVFSGAVTGANPGTSIVTGTVSGSLGTPVALQ